MYNVNINIQAYLFNKLLFIVIYLPRHALILLFLSFYLGDIDAVFVPITVCMNKVVLETYQAMKSALFGIILLLVSFL